MYKKEHAQFVQIMCKIHQFRIICVFLGAWPISQVAAQPQSIVFESVARSWISFCVSCVLHRFPIKKIETIIFETYNFRREGSPHSRTGKGKSGSAMAAAAGGSTGSSSRHQ